MNGAPPGSDLSSPTATNHGPLSPTQGREAVESQVGGINPPVVKDDPGYQPPTDNAKAGNIKARTSVVMRQIPLTTVTERWTIDEIYAALCGHSAGLFDWSSQLWDAITGDDRIQATLDARVDGLLGAEQIVIPSTVDRVKGSDAAKEVARAWQDNLTRIYSEAAASEVQRWLIGMGWGLGSLSWDVSAYPWIPILDSFHPRFTWWHWTLQKYIAITLDGQRAVFPGDGNWVLFQRSSYRAWMRGAIRSTSTPWVIRRDVWKDWANFSEVHGMPMRVGKVPAAADPVERSQYEASLATIGHAASIILPQGVDGASLGYGLDLLEAKDTAGKDAFSGLMDRCDMAIVLAMQGQNLTTEVTEGSFAAARVHAGVKQTKLESDERGEALTIYQQMARPFALVNYGDADLAPITRRDITPNEDYLVNAELFAKVGTAIEVLARGGVQFKDPAEVIKFVREKFGLTGMPDFEIKPPVAGGLGGAK